MKVKKIEEGRLNMISKIKTIFQKWLGIDLLFEMHPEEDVGIRPLDQPITIKNSVVYSTNGNIVDSMREGVVADMLDDLGIPFWNNVHINYPEPLRNGSIYASVDFVIRSKVNFIIECSPMTSARYRRNLDNKRRMLERMGFTVLVIKGDQLRNAIRLKEMLRDALS